jgi:hypothetical protein
MQTHEIQVSGASEQVHEIRGELFAFPEVLEVFVTGRPDALLRPAFAVWERERPIACLLQRPGSGSPIELRSALAPGEPPWSSALPNSSVRTRRDATM